MEWEIDEIVEELNIDFSISKLSRLLGIVGIIDTGIKPEQIDFNQFIFLRCETDEIYGEKERNFIKQIGSIYLFPEVKRAVSKGVIPYRIIAVDLRDAGSDVYSAVLFMKIVIKAYDGWSMFIVRLSDGIHIGMKTYERDPKKNCILCESTKVGKLLDDLMWETDIEDFLRFYSLMFEMVNPVDTYMKDYDEMIMRRRGIQYEYIEGLESIGRYMNLDFSYAIKCHKEWFEENYSYPFFMELQDALEYLKDIKSSKVNTLEMLFEAEELERITYDNEQKYIQSEEEYSVEDDVELNVDEKKPEEIIKLIKERKGII